MHERIDMSFPDIEPADIEAVVEVLRSGRLSLGPRLDEFERALAGWVGTRHAVAVSSGTAALHLLVRGLGIGPGDEVLVPSFTFAASVNVVLQEGAVPIFVDIEPDVYTMSVEDAERKITPRTKAILAVDLFGHPAEWDAILELARRHGLRTIDDSCEALGATYRGRRLGSFGDAAAFAFYPNKQITTGEGGALVTDDDGLAALARSLRNQGRAAMGAGREHERAGYNYRMDEMSAALGLSQLGRIDELLARRERVAAAYTERLAAVPAVRAPVVRDHVGMSWFVYVVTLGEGLEREAVIAALEARGVPARGYFVPIHTQPYLRSHPARAVRLPVTERAARRTVALPFHGRLGMAALDRVVQTLAEVTSGWVRTAERCDS
jgi:perosamine synthetase